jgi:hypothetical protein
MLHCDVALIGAGPFGLSAAAHLQRIKGLDVVAFGEPMAFWKKCMPDGMLLRSAWSASHIADPDCALTLDAYRAAGGNHIASPVPLHRFVEYGLWFQRKAAPKIENRAVTRIDLQPSGFALSFNQGPSVKARRVIVAAGMAAFAYRPAPFVGLPSALVSHSSEQQHPKFLSGRRVAVVGSGQSALESAALLHEAGAEVEVIMRRSAIHWLGWKERLQYLGAFGRMAISPADVGPAGVGRLVALPDLFKRLPQSLQDRLHRLCIRPAGASWLRNRLPAVPVTPLCSIVSAAVSNSALQLVLSDSSTRCVDHVVLGTGYRIDVLRYPFLSPAIKNNLETVRGFPVLNRSFESSIPGLHFIGAPSAWSFGPLMYFVSGTRYSGGALYRAFAGGSNVAGKAA